MTTYVNKDLEKKKKTQEYFAEDKKITNSVWEHTGPALLRSRVIAKYISLTSDNFSHK